MQIQVQALLRDITLGLVSLNIALAVSKCTRRRRRRRRHCRRESIAWTPLKPPHLFHNALHSKWSRGLPVDRAKAIIIILCRRGSFRCEPVDYLLHWWLWRRWRRRHSRSRRRRPEHNGGGYKSRGHRFRIVFSTWLDHPLLANKSLHTAANAICIAMLREFDTVGTEIHRNHYVRAQTPLLTACLQSFSSTNSVCAP